MSISFLCSLGAIDMLYYDEEAFYLKYISAKSESELTDIICKLLKSEGYDIISINKGNPQHRPDIIAEKGDSKIMFEVKYPTSGTNKKITMGVNQLISYLHDELYSDIKIGYVVLHKPVNGILLKSLNMFGKTNMYKLKKNQEIHNTRQLGFGFPCIVEDNLTLYLSHGNRWVATSPHETTSILKMGSISVENIQYASKKLTPDTLFDYIFYELWLQNKYEWRKLLSQLIPNKDDKNSIMDTLEIVAKDRGYVLKNNTYKM
jgi:Holliday junction resolvase